MGRTTNYSIFLPVLLLVMGLFYLIAIPSVFAATDVFTIENVQVDVTADSALKAQEAAFNQAQQAAFRQLSEQLLSEAELERLDPPEINIIAPLIKDFEVTEESFSSVRYVGVYTFRFDAADVRNYFSNLGVAYTDVSSKPVLVLPYYQWGAQTIIWGPNNPWLAAWAAQKSYRGLVPVTIPIGDLDDVSDIGSEKPLSYDPNGLERMLERYGAADALILLAVPLWQTALASGPPDALDVLVYRTDKAQPELVNRLRVNAEGKDHSDLFRKAAIAAHQSLQDAWKEKTLVDPAQGNNLIVRVRYREMKEWIETQSALRRVRGITDLRLVSLTPGEAEIELAFQGSETRLRLALAQSDLILTTPQIDFSRGFTDSPLIYELYLKKYQPTRTY